MNELGCENNRIRSAIACSFHWFHSVFCSICKKRLPKGDNDQRKNVLYFIECNIVRQQQPQHRDWKSMSNMKKRKKWKFCHLSDYYFASFRISGTVLNFHGLPFCKEFFSLVSFIIQAKTATLQYFILICSTLSKTEKKIQ